MLCFDVSLCYNKFPEFIQVTLISFIIKKGQSCSLLLSFSPGTSQFNMMSFQLRILRIPKKSHLLIQGCPDQSLFYGRIQLGNAPQENQLKKYLTAVFFPLQIVFPMWTHNFDSGQEAISFLFPSLQDKADLSNSNEAFSTVQVIKDKARAWQREEGELSPDIFPGHGSSNHRCLPQQEKHTKSSTRSYGYELGLVEPA